MLNAKKDEQNQTQHNAAMSTTNLAKNRNKDVLPSKFSPSYFPKYVKCHFNGMILVIGYRNL